MIEFAAKQKREQANGITSHAGAKDLTDAVPAQRLQKLFLTEGNLGQFPGEIDIRC